MNKILLLAGVAALALASACSSDDDKSSPDNPDKKTQQENYQLPEAPKTRVDIPLSDRQKELMESKSTFDFNFFRSAYANAHSDAKKLFVVSPYSASVFMAMLAEGADDVLRQKMINAFLPVGADVEEMGAMMKLMSESLVEIDNAVQFKESNSVWHDNKVTVGIDFTKAINDYFKAPVLECDMFSKEGGNLINEWVKESTNGIIDRIVSGAPCTRLLLANAIYFRGTWTEPFDESLTGKYNFTDYSGVKTRVDMMTGHSDAQGYQGSDYQVLSLPYGNKAYSMSIILPNTSTDDFIATLTPDQWKDIQKNLRNGRYDIRLPKFSVTNENFNLEDALRAIGFEEIFTNDARYSRIIQDLSGNNLELLQTTKLKVDEKGTEGAAITWGIEVSVDPGSGGKTLTKFYVDRPFVFIIDEISTGAVLFAGVVNEL